MSMAGPPHWMAIKCIMRCLKGLLGFKICLGDKVIVLRGIVMWIGRDMQTTGDPPWGTYYFVGIGAISWKCKKQPTVTLPTTEVEYMPTSHCTKKMVLIQQFWRSTCKPPIIMCSTKCGYTLVPITIIFTCSCFGKIKLASWIFCKVSIVVFFYFYCVFHEFIKNG